MKDELKAVTNRMNNAEINKWSGRYSNEIDQSERQTEIQMKKMKVT